MNNKGSDSSNGKKPVNFMTVLIAALLVTFFINMLMQTLFASSIIRVPYSEFLEMVRSGYVERVEVQHDRLLITVRADYTPKSVAEMYPEGDYPNESGAFGGPIAFLDSIRIQT